MKDFKKKLAFVSFGVVYWTAAIIAIVWLMFGAGDMFGFPYAFVALIVGFTASRSTKRFGTGKLIRREHGIARQPRPLAFFAQKKRLIMRRKPT